MGISIREQNRKRTSRLHPQELDVDLDQPAGGVVRVPVSLGFDTEVLSHFFGFHLSRRAEIRVPRISEDPYAAHVGASLGLVDERVSEPLWSSAWGDSGWRVLEAGTYRMVVGSTFPAEQQLLLVFAARPMRAGGSRRVHVAGVVEVDETANAVARLRAFEPVPMQDVRTVERYRDLVLDIPIDRKQLVFDFTTWDVWIDVFTDDPLQPLFIGKLDQGALAQDRFAITIADIETATWPDQVNVLIAGRNPYGREAILLIGVWTVVNAVDGPEHILGDPAIDDGILVERFASLLYVMGLQTTSNRLPVDLSGWRARMDLWNVGFTNVLASADGVLPKTPKGAAIFEVVPSFTARLPEAFNIRAWLIDPDGGSHWMIRGRWASAQGYSRDEVRAVRDDRVIQAGDDILYRLQLKLNGQVVLYPGAMGVLRLSHVDGSPLGSAADRPIPLDPAQLALGVAAAEIPHTITGLLSGQVAMTVLLDLANGRRNVVVGAGLWTVSQGFTRTLP
jgi:hypothetical protein